ncbi:dermonecrotic toxin domain-containing protein [Pseudomonas sp.]|uniref:dermonecrotic toxin domain-containing protein n=1 Tax=Pseudomonas sp. TaxID=306 RepID=UPI003F2E7978
MPDTASPSSENILTQLVTGPSIREVAATALAPALNTLYPHLKIDPTLATVVTPTWVDTGNDVVPGDKVYETLTDVLVRLGLSGSTVTLIDGEHFLTLQPGAEPQIQLPVKIDALGCLLNTLAPQLFIAYQQQQLDYWNQETKPSTPRWHSLSRSLQEIWNLDEASDWNEDEKSMAKAVFNDPDRATRRPQDKYLTKACLIDTDCVEKAVSEHVRVLDIAVFVGTVGTRTLVLTHSIAEGFKRYDSIAALGDTLFAQPGTSSSEQTLQWRLYEPKGNFFHHQACALIALEAEAIGALNTFQNESPANLSPHISASAKSIIDTAALPASRFSKVQGLLTGWVMNASSADLTRYSRHLMDLALLREQDAGKVFDEGIASLPVFTLNTLREQMIKDHPAAAGLNLEDVQISITSVIVLGAVVVPGKTQTVTLSLIELALQNLIAVPLGNKTVQYKNGDAVPAWMTSSYLETLVTKVDIGAVYPALIKRKLLEDPQESVRRQALYTRHLRTQLPLQALQHKMRGEAGIDERGYQFVNAAMQENIADRRVNGLEIVIRPLAFITGDRANSKGDEVANMFVIGPRSADQGPCLLYRPLLTPSLTQYPNEANLLYAIKHEKPLRQSVLAWLGDDVRFNYSQYVFSGELPSVWTLTQLLVDPTSALGMMGKVSLSAAALDDASLATLFKANVNFMITLADRQSVSNAQARWATLKHGAWMLFNVALPFLGRTAGVAAWIWQIMDDLQAMTDAKENDDSESAWSALTDLLLTLGMVLAHRAATRNKPMAHLPEKLEPPLVTPPTRTESKITVTRLSDLNQLPAAHEISLHATAALPATALGVLLDELAIAEPKGMAAASSNPGPHQHLSSLNGKLYAKVGQRWFEVTLDDNDVQITDSRQTPARTGPLLVKNANGEWFIDTRLRLRGGGKGKQRLQEQNRQRQAELKQQMIAFESQTKSRETELKEAEKNAQGADATDAHRRLYLELLDTQLSAISVNLEQMKAFNAREAIPNYRKAMISRLDFQLSLLEKWFNHQRPVFNDQMRLSLDLLDTQPTGDTQTARQTFQHMSDLTAGYIQKIEFAQSRFEQLNLLGKEAIEVIRDVKANMPSFDLQDLKMFQITLGQELCLVTSSAAASEARQALGNVVENAALAIQASLDLAADEEVLRLPERIAGLSDLVEQLTLSDQHILDLPTEFPGQFLQAPLDSMRQRINDFYKRTVKHLASLLRERQALEPQPGPSRLPAVPARRIIKTRYKGTVVGQIRPDPLAHGTELLDVTSGLTGKVISTFHEKTPGEWVERVISTQVSPAVAPPDVRTSILQGQALLDAQDAFIRRTEAHSKGTRRIPVEIEEMFHQEARRLQKAASAIDDALIASNSTDSGPGSAVALIRQLNDAATRLYSRGSETRISMTKLQPPTAERVQWLQTKGQVDIVKNPGRRLLKTRKKDYLEEYEIRDHSTQKVLWYAHFHYSQPASPAPAFTAAHLKTVEQRLLGGAIEARSVTDDLQTISIYRSEISQPLATTLFFANVPSTSSGS